VKVVPATYDALVAQLCSGYLDEAEEDVVLAALKKMPVASRDECVAVAIANGAVHRVTPGMLALASPKLRARVAGKPEARAKAKAAPAPKRKKAGAAKKKAGAARTSALPR